MRILSLGAGVQSSTLLLMACHGELDLDGAIFADTGWEPGGVYGWLSVLQELSEAAGVPLWRVGSGDIRSRTLETGQRYASLPFYVRAPDGTLGMGRRQCTKEYKLAPIRRKIRELGATHRRPIEMLIGISLDEYQRMGPSSVKYIRNVFPLVEMRMTRGDCLAWLSRHGYPEPQKSACIGCPYRKDAEWRKLNAEEFADAVDFDQRVRDLQGTWRGQLYVHRSGTPLEGVDLRSEQDRGQLEMFGGGDGCGVLCAADDEDAGALT